MTPASPNQASPNPASPTSGPPLPAPLVSTQWLADHLGAERLVVLDATVNAASAPHHGYVIGDERYLLDGHIPGALFADLLESFSDPDGAHPFTRPGADRFAAAAGALGIDRETTVVVYDAAVGQWASRVWWLFRAFGHDDVAVLDGGLTKWRAEDRETDIGHVEARTAVFEAAERPGLWVDKATVERIVSGDEPGALVCGVPPKEFTGDEGSRPRAGHIPGSLSVPAGRLVDRVSNAYLPATTLGEVFAPVAEAERVVTYCGAGIAAASDALALTLLGHRNVAIYDGSLNEWAADPDSALVTGGQ